MTPKLALRISAIALALLCAAGLWRVISGLMLQVPLDPNEGWNAYHTLSLMSGHGLYPPREAYLVNNYPPLSFYIVGAVGWIVGDNIFAGRIVSLAALSFVVFAMQAIARQLGVSRALAWFPGLIFTAGMVLFTDYAGMDDPQMLAHAFAMGGLWLALVSPRTMKTISAAAALFVISIFVKHNIVALPVVLGLWLLVHDRKMGLRFAAVGLGLGLLGLIAFRLAYGISLLSVVATARSYSFDLLHEGLTAWLNWGLVPLAGLCVLLWQRWRDPAVQLCAGFALAGLGLGIVFLGGAGVDVNALFEADIALALSVALLLEHLRGYWRAAAGAAFALPFLFFAATNEEWQHANLTLHPMAEEARLAASDIAFLKTQKGPALCEMLSFCYWAGKAPQVDFFNVGQAFETGARSDAEITAAIDAKRYGALQFDPDSPYSLGENVHNAMERNYRAHHEDGYGTFYTPK